MQRRGIVIVMESSEGRGAMRIFGPRLFPNHSELGCSWVGKVGTGTFIRATGLQRFLQRVDLLSLRARLVVSQKRYPIAFPRIPSETRELKRMGRVFLVEM